MRWFVWLVAPCCALVLAACGGDDAPSDDGDADADADTDTSTDTGSDADADADGDTDTLGPSQVGLIGIAREFVPPNEVLTGRLVLLDDTERTAKTAFDGSVYFAVDEDTVQKLIMNVEGYLPLTTVCPILDEQYTAVMSLIPRAHHDTVLAQFKQTPSDALGHLVVFVLRSTGAAEPDAEVVIDATYGTALVTDVKDVYQQGTILLEDGRAFVWFVNVEPGDVNITVHPRACLGEDTVTVEAGAVTLTRYDC